MAQPNINNPNTPHAPMNLDDIDFSDLMATILSPEQPYNTLPEWNQEQQPKEKNPRKRQRPNEPGTTLYNTKFNPSGPEMDTTMPEHVQRSIFTMQDNNAILPEQIECQTTTFPEQANLLQQITREIEILKTELKHICSAQQSLQVPVQHFDFDQLDTDQRRMLNVCHSLREKLEQIKSSTILSPPFIFQLLSLDQELNILLKKLSLYQEELHYYCSYNPTTSQPRCFSTLVIIKQPFPKPIKHNTRAQSGTEEPVIVELISAPKASCRPEGLVKAQLMHEDFHSKQGNVKITNSEQQMDEEGFVRFADLRFPSGSRQKIVRLQFVVDVTYIQPNGAPGKQLLESDLTQPFIVMTNENQWKVSEGALLKKSAFEGRETIPWARFANILQVHYLRATRQDPSEPQRPLSIRELSYISQLEQFKDKPSIHIRDFESFWNWFGDAMHKIRHQKTFSTMWLFGEIFGFVSKTDVTNLLANHPQGTFLIRFSERSNGSVAAAYTEIDPTSNRKKIKHYLLQPKDCDNIADFFHSHSNFQWFLPARTEFSCRIGNCLKNRVMKREITKKYCTQESNPNTPGGYTPLTDHNQPYFLPDL